jgi:hypothetical protein
MERLTLSLSDEVARQVRAAAAEDGVSVPTWLAAAAELALRRRQLDRPDWEVDGDLERGNAPRTDGL